MKPDQRTIDDIRVRLRLEPLIREIYVEGEFDRDFYRWVLEKLDVRDVKVYPISTLNISDELLAKHGLTSGARQKVQAAAKELESDSDIHPQALFMIDADLDHLLNRAQYKAPLEATTETSAELIFWKEQIIARFASMVLAQENPSLFASEKMSFVEPIAVAFCIFRSAKEKISANWSLISIEDTFDKKNGFDFGELLQKVTNKNAVPKDIVGKFVSAFKEIEESAKPLPTTQKVHGHDVIAALSRKLRIDGFQQKCLIDVIELGRILMSSTEWDWVNNSGTIEKIRQYFPRKEPKNSTDSTPQGIRNSPAKFNVLD